MKMRLSNFLVFNCYFMQKRYILMFTHIVPAFFKTIIRNHSLSKKRSRLYTLAYDVRS